MAKSKKPKGLSIKRDGFKFTCTWKQDEPDYDGGQKFEWRTKGKTGWRKWNSESCGDKTTSKAIPLKAADFYPNKQAFLLEFQFRVKGNRKSYKQKGNTINPGWSDWNDKSYTIKEPPKPKLTQGLVSGTSNQTEFGWSMDSLTEHQMFSNTEWQTSLVMDCNYTDGSKASYGSSTTATGSGTRTIEETSSMLADGHSYTRWFRMRARGPAGPLDNNSGWVYIKHVYAKTNMPVNTTVKTQAVTGGIEVIVNWNSSNTNARPIDSIKIEKLITTPAVGLNPPAGASWTEVASVKPKDGNDGYRYVETTSPTDDQCLFIRANTIHDGNENPGAAVFACAGTLSPITSIGISANGQYHRVWVAVSNSSSIPDAHTALVFHGSSIAPYVAGVIPHGEESDSYVIQCPNWDDEDSWVIEAYTFVGNYTKQTRSDGLDSYTLSAYPGRPLLKSTILSTTGTVPKAPTGLTLSETNVSGTIRATWNWTWTEATGTELSWADHEDAWESTDEPDTYDITNLHSGAWNISGLEYGKRWYVRTRFFNGTGDNKTYGPYSDIAEIDLSSAPETPQLRLSDSVITANGETTAYWAYVTGDGTSQVYAELCTATISSGVISYGSIIAHTETASSVTLNAAELGWTSGNTYNVCVRLYSASGNKSEWSPLASVTIATPVSCAITSTSLETVTVPDDDDDETTRQALSLTELPLTVTVSGSGSDKTLIVDIERDEDYHIERPDENYFNGYEGETIALITAAEGQSQIDIGIDDLIGPLDDGASYRIIATVKDAYGQSASSAPLQFEVHWSHQALMPTADVSIDEDLHVAFITPYAPSGVAQTDRADIYRLSLDKPQLIYEDAEFGETYVDPYPTLGDMGGHRIVFKTENGDFITEDNKIAWIDVNTTDGDEVDLDMAIINFDDEEIILNHNIDISNSWEKDFKETRYLGGSVQGDWNMGTGRTMSLSASAISIRDQEKMQAMRRLSVYTGLCHVRTPDGSSFSADIQVKEERSHSNGRMIVKYSLEITRVESEILDGLTYSDWAEGRQGEYQYNIVSGNLYETAESESGNSFSINQAGELIWNPSSTVDDITFNLKDGELEVDYGS